MCDLVFAGLLRGQTIEQLVKDGKVFFQDYHTVLATDIAPKVYQILPSLVSKTLLEQHTEMSSFT